ncbi:hypothetical protein J7K55_06480 [Candidatus Aerophobetes bacterium]|nr:hypothetical protein [Candidatus Aerophobetes bacterium]
MIRLIKKLTDVGWELYEIYIIKRGKQLSFISFIIFLLTIFICRCIVIWIEAGRPFLNFFRVSDYHIHHFYLGIFLIILSNWFLLLRSKKRYIEKVKVSSSILFGVGLGLITDEFGLLLTMEFDIKGDYWAPHSYYLMGIISGIFLYNIIFPRYKQ